MKRRRIIRRGDLRLAAAVLATVAFAVLLNHQPSQPSQTSESIWIDSTVLRLNLPADAVRSDGLSIARQRNELSRHAGSF